MVGDVTARLAAHKLIALDTSVLVYYLEGHPHFGQIAAVVLSAVIAGRVQAVLCAIALMELLVRPLATGQPEIADEHEQALQQVPHLRIVAFNGTAHRRAAELRARYGIRPPDALLLGSALAEGATAYVTNDKGLRKISELAVIVLSDFVE